MAVDAFLKLTGQVSGWIKGESKDKAHADWIEIESFSWGALSPRDTASGLPTGKRQYQPIRFVAKLGKDTPLQLQALARNENLSEVLLGVRRSGATFDYLEVKLTNANLASWDLGGAGEEAELEYGFTFQKVEMTHFEQNPDGSKGSARFFEDDWEAPIA